MGETVRGVLQVAGAVVIVAAVLMAIVLIEGRLGRRAPRRPGNYRARGRNGPRSPHLATAVSCRPPARREDAAGPA